MTQSKNYPESFKAIDKAADAIENAKYNLKGEFIIVYLFGMQSN